MSAPATSPSAPGTRGSVLLLCKHAGFGGTERMVQHLARGLPAAGVSARAVLPDTASSAAVLAWFRRNGVDAEANPAVRGRLRWRDLRSLGEFVRGRRAEVANLHFAWREIPQGAESSFSLTAMIERYADLLAPGRYGPR